MDLSSYAVVIPVVIICYLCGVIVKAFDKIDNRYIPMIVGIIGGILGVVGFYVIPDFPAEDLMTAVSVGIMSGLASTGVNELYKQMRG